MKILFVAPRFHTNQVEIVNSLLLRGHSLCFHVNYIGKTEDHSSVIPSVFSACWLSRLLESVFGPGPGDRPLLFPSPFKYFWALLSIRPDLIIIRNPTRIFSLIAAFSSYMLGSKIIFYTQTEIHQRRPFLLSIRATILLAFFRAAWYSPLIGNKQLYPQRLRQLHYVPFAVPRPNLSERPSTYGPPSRILMIGKYESLRKNHHLFIAALSDLAQTHQFTATIVGEATNTDHSSGYAKVKNLLSATGLSSVVTLFHNVSHRDLRSMMLEHDILVNPAHSEPASISLLEGLACGLPSICSHTCGTRSYIKHGYNGLIFVDNSKDSLVDQLRLLLDDPALWFMMHKNCINSYEDSISGDEYCRNLNLLLNHKWGAAI